MGTPWLCCLAANLALEEGTRIDFLDLKFVHCTLAIRIKSSGCTNCLNRYVAQACPTRAEEASSIAVHLRRSRKHRHRIEVAPCLPVRCPPLANSSNMDDNRMPMAAAPPMDSDRSRRLGTANGAGAMANSRNTIISSITTSGTTISSITINTTTMDNVRVASIDGTIVANRNGAGVSQRHRNPKRKRTRLRLWRVALHRPPSHRRKRPSMLRCKVLTVKRG